MQKTRTNTATWDDKQNRWQVKVQRDGIRKSFYSSIHGRDGQREANFKADQWLDSDVANTKTKVCDLYDDYINEKKLTTSKSNWFYIESRANKWILPRIGTKKISKLTENQMQSVLNDAYSAGLSYKSIANIRADMTNFVKFCRKRKLTSLIPEDLYIPKSATKSTKKILQPNDLKTLFTHDTIVTYGKTVPEPYINAFRFQVLTGLRPGELLALEWADITNDMVYINKSINIYGEQTSGKNDNAIRHFALNDMTKQILQDQFTYTGDNVRVFPIISQKSYYRRWLNYCKANNIPHISTYELRHTFISIVKNLPAGQVKSLVGHSKNMDTFGVYGHELNGELKETANCINMLFENLLDG